MRVLPVIVGAALFCGPATAGPARDAARAAERQVDSLRRIERIDRERARDIDRDRRNAMRDARSLRR